MPDDVLDFVPVSLRARAHPKILDLAQRIGARHVAAALGHWVALLTWAAQNAPDGDVTALFSGGDLAATVAANALACREADAKDVLDAMIAARLVDRLDDGRALIHGWTDTGGAGAYLSARAAKRIAARERARKHWERGKADRDADNLRADYAQTTRNLQSERERESETENESESSQSPDGDSAEPDRGRSDSTADDPLLSELRGLHGFDAYPWNSGAARKWAAATRAGFPRLDVADEARRASAWLAANPQRQPRTERGARSFLTRWFGRSDEWARRHTSTNGKGAKWDDVLHDDAAALPVLKVLEGGS